MRPLAIALAFTFHCPAQFFPANPAGAAPQPSQTKPNAATLAANRVEMEVKGDQTWVDTGMDIAAGETIKVTGTGTIRFSNAKEDNGPEGLKRGFLDMIRTVPVPDAGRGALIGRIGDRDATRAFAVGAERVQRAGLAGRLFLGINTTSMEKASGSFRVVVERLTPASVATGVARPSQAPAKLTAKLTQAQLDSIPRRVAGDDGTPGDRTNFVIVGAEHQVRDGLQKAGWVIVDRSKKDAVLRGMMTVLSKQAYTTLPMSELMLFGRAQDYGYAQGDPLRVIAARHHFRIWRAPFDIGGQPAWAGAGTHDVGFDKDQRNGKVTHKIDPDTDKERDYIGNSLNETGMVALLDYMTAKDPITKARTAHGQEFFSDGRTLVIYLTPDSTDVSKQFADVFCSVLARSNPDGGDWGSCDRWIETKGQTNVRLSQIPGPDKYRVVVVPGFFSSCFPEAPAFLEAHQPLKEKHGYQVDVFGVPNDSSEDNAEKIAAYLRTEAAKDKRKFIIVGYSKGTPDLQVMLANYPDVRASVAAFISVAGASGGSHLAETAPAVAEKYMNQFQISKSCQGDVSKGFKSLGKSVRMAFLAKYPDPLVPTYSIPAIATDAIMSKAVATTAKVVAAFDRDQDGQLTRPDAIVPGSKVLGGAKSDHFALALPFEKAQGSSFGAMMDKNRYPRGALLEAMLRFVVADLEAGNRPQ
jgi:dienelactone hydrolase